MFVGKNMAVAASVGAEIRLRVPESRPVSLRGRENTPERAGIPPDPEPTGG